MEDVTVPWETMMGKVKNYIDVEKWIKMKMLVIVRQSVIMINQVLYTNYGCILDPPFLVLVSEECTVLRTWIFLVSSRWR